MYQLLDGEVSVDMRHAVLTSGMQLRLYPLLTSAMQSRCAQPPCVFLATVNLKPKP